MTQFLETDSGLAVPLTGADEASVNRALKEYDPDLFLIPQECDSQGRIMYRVGRRVGGDRPIQWIVSWRTPEGEALPLSHRLVETVKKLDLNTRSRVDDPDELNAALRAERERDLEREMENLREDWQMKHGRPILPRSQALRMSRDKRRARGEKI